MKAVHYQIQVASENSLIVYFGDEPGLKADQHIAQQVQYAKQSIEQHLGGMLVELIPSYASLLITFDPFKTDQYLIRHLLRKEMAKISEQVAKGGETVEIPVYYSEETGPDLNRIAIKSGLSIEQVIEQHQVDSYRVYAIGFAPGFGYLGEVNERIAMPRLATPRDKVPKGAVGIADKQTAIYPAESPGGWNIIGRCPLNMFDPNQQPHMPFDVGDRVKFRAISKKEYFDMGGKL